MEFSLLTIFPYMVIFIAPVVSYIVYIKNSYFSTQKKNLPPGNLGLPIIGESLAFLSQGRRGTPEKFLFDRMTKFSSQLFKSSLFGEPMVIFCGAEANKFLFSNESKLVTLWWPSSMDKLFPPLKDELSSNEEGKKLHMILKSAVKPESYSKYVSVMDRIANRHFASCWDGANEVHVFPLAKRFTFAAASCLFLSINDPEEVAKLEKPFEILASGTVTLPLDFPGTLFYRAVKASKAVREHFRVIINKQRKVQLLESKGAATGGDVLSHMIAYEDENGQRLSDENIAKKILGLLIGGHDTASSAITFIVKYLAEFPNVYDKVYNEQMEISKSKAAGELLDWDDIKKMKYTWNVACEVLRLVPPVQGSFRQAIKDFEYAGFSIPKGWKIYSSPHSTHLDPQCFPEPRKFDPSRFDGKARLAPYTFIPFGGGPRMCPGNEYARLEILVFIHNIVKRFKWEKMLPDERIVVSPVPVPENGLPVRVYPHN